MKLKIVNQKNTLKFNKVITLFGKTDIKKYNVWKSFKIKDTTFIILIKTKKKGK